MMKKRSAGNSENVLEPQALLSDALRASKQGRAGSMLQGLRASADPRPRFAHRAAYYKHCKARLLRALTPFWRGSRAALKHHLRAMLKPRRRDTRYLSGLLRAAATPALLAVLLGIGGGPAAHADTVCAVSFAERTGADNPVADVAVGTFSSPAFADIDADGDWDALIGNRDPGAPGDPEGEDDGGGPSLTDQLALFKNTGTVIAPAWKNRTGIIPSFYDTNSTYHVTVGDLDADGDYDIVLGSYDDGLRYFENTGTVEAIVITERNGGANPFNGISFSYYSAPILGDLDGDGDLDVIGGDYTGRFKYLENTGTASAPAYTQRSGALNPLNGVDVGDSSRPALADLDGDGDLDMLAGNANGVLLYFENTGTPLAPAFVQRMGGGNPFDGVDVGTYSAPVFSDIDGDHDLDAIVGEQGGGLRYFENTSPKATPVFTEQSGAANPMNGINTGGYANPNFADVDGDGDLDAVVGRGTWVKMNLHDKIRYYENTGTAIAPAFVERIRPDNPFDKDLGIGSVKLDFADLDRDGDLDALAANLDGVFYYLENTGSATAPNYNVRTGAANPLDIDIGRYAAIAIADLDADGDYDVAAGENNGRVRYYLNTGTALVPVFAQQTGASNPFDGFDVGGGSQPEFHDADGDGDWDVFIGAGDGSVAYAENIGTPLVPSFVLRTGLQNPMNGVDAGNHASPGIADIDGDGDTDIFVGYITGGIAYFSSAPDCTPPAAACMDITVDLDATGNLTIAGTDLDDGSTDNIAIAAYTANPDTFTCADLGANTVTLTVIDGGGLTDSCTATVTVQDVTPPVITLNGAAAESIDCNGGYAEQGAAAADACDTSLPAPTIGGDTVNTTIPGDYIVTYDVMDASGNAALQATRTVTVLNNCTTLTVDGAGGTVNATAGEAVTLGVGISGVNGSINNIQWYYDDGSKIAAPIADGGNFGGANTTALLIDPVQLGNAGDYYCEVSDDLDTVISSTFSLVVNAAVSALGALGMGALAGLIALTGAIRRGT